MRIRVRRDSGGALSRGAAAATAVALAGGLALTATPASAAGTPEFDRVLGGPGHAMLYPSGLEIGPDGSVVVADTGNDKVTKYAPNGSVRWELTKLAGDDGPLVNTRDIAVADDGTIYVADAGRSRIVKLSASGSQIGAPWRGPTNDRIGSPIGISEKNGLIYVADGAKKKIRVFQPDGTQVRTLGSTGACQMAAVRDADADEAGNVYVANYTNQNILKLSSTGACLDSWGVKGTGNGQFKNPYGIRLAQDPTWGESVYVADSNNNRVQIFSKSGAFRAVVGGDGNPDQPGTFTTMRRVAVAADGDVWGADLWGSRAVRFNRTSSGFSYAQTIGNGLAPLTSNAVFNEVRGIDFSADGTLNAVDTVNQRVVRMSPSGAVLGSCGGRTEATTSINWPRDVAVDPVTGDRWVADTKQSRLQVWPVNCAGLSRIGGGGAGSGLSQFNWPHAIEIRASDRVAFVADTKNNRVLAYNVATESPLHQFGSLGSGTNRFNNPRGLAVASDGTILVADSRNDRVVRLGYSKGGGFTWRATYQSGFDEPEGLATESDGTIWVADTGNNRVVLLSSSGAFERTLSSAAGKSFNAPASIAVEDDDRAYVSDTENDRIVVYTNGGSGGPPPADASPPSVAVSNPSQDEVFASTPVALSGTATDDVGVTRVAVAVQNRATKRWWQADGSWGPWSTRQLDASLGSPGATSTSWSYAFDPGADGLFGLQVQAFDASGKESSRVWRRFEVDGAGAPPGGSEAPTVSVGNPSQDEVFASRPVVLSGSASDDVGVIRVTVAIQDRVTKRWLQADGSFGPWSSRHRDAVLGTPGGTSTSWSFSFNPGGAGDYGVQVRSYDADGNESGQIWRRFDITG